MYRQYEDPRELEKELAELRGKYQELSYILDYHNTAELQEQLYYLHDKIAELEERVNFAWQDEEFG
ncbi:hypothetical protein [Butyrivibrio sp. INlla21]|uniref:hypothetical protein n=1 Tax=Butyrivibrio sp. INlla21 TaxID=1520811 RepID=UPI0008E11FC2|nr:hypothetical protein [Butyrivibrio sp. INlla21]SFU36732.1 hypothetical protein SAMN02910342_00271 [Butyrivibrio sp. INlla21]